MKVRYIRLLVAGIIILTFLFYSVVSSWNLQGHLSAYSTDWADLSDFKHWLDEHNYNTESIVSTTLILKEVESPEKTLYIAAGVEKKYSSEELEAIEEFLSKGGKAIIADDYSCGNSISERFGVHIYGCDLLASEFNKNISFVNLTARLSGENFTLISSNPTGLQVSGSIGNIIGNSSSESYLDLNRNGIIDIGDLQGPIPTIVEIETGNGKIVFISDPSLFINDLWNKANNSAFIGTLVRYLLQGADNTVIFDESRHAQNKYSLLAYQSIGLMVLITAEDYSSLIMLFYIGVVLCLIGIRIKDKSDWRHRYNPDTITLRPIVPIGIQQARLKQLILNKIQMENRIEKLSLENRDNIRKVVDDVFIVNFLCGKRDYEEKEFKVILEKVREWSKKKQVGE